MTEFAGVAVAGGPSFDRGLELLVKDRSKPEDAPKDSGKTTVEDVIKDPKSPFWFRHVTGPAIKRMNDALPSSYRMDDIREVRGDLNWCRFRRDSHCFFPIGLDEQATRVAGYDVFIPEDRGLCHRHRWDVQEECKIAEPGPRSGAKNWKPDATRRWDQGGQRP